MQRLSELGIAYRRSPIVEGPGKRYFDDSLRGGNGIRSRFLLVLGNQAESSSIEAAKQFAQSFADILEFRSTRGQELALVRPDGYLAYSAPNGDSLAVLESVRAVLQRQTMPTPDAEPAA
ncbi:MAG: hypothetical protein WB711_12180 [Terriglobales bacterium]